MIRTSRIGNQGWLLMLSALSLASCDWTEPKAPGVEERTAKQKLADARRLRQACGSAQTYDRLKALTFDEVDKVRVGASPILDRIAANTTVRMDSPVVKSRDEQLDVTVCSGHLVMALPPGLRDTFDGRALLEADVEYSAQEAVDGSGLVYQMKGAEPIIYRLAALTLPAGSGERLAAAPANVAAAPDAAAAAAAAAAEPPVPGPDLARVAAAAPTPPPARPAPAEDLDRRSETLPPVARDVAAPARRTVGAARPSFDCGRVSSRVLTMVCSDPGLAAQDRAMSSAFYAALANGDGRTRSALRQSRDRFLSSRNRCATPACVSQAYADRVDEINAIAAGQ